MRVPSYASRAIGERRPGIGRSFRLHRPRGPYCGRGYCHQCLVAVRGAAPELACEIPATANVDRSIDVRRPFGFVAEFLPPWFYENHFLRPRVFRDRYLSVLRHLTSSARTPPEPAPPPGRLRRLECDVLVVGAGRAGTEVAALLASRGSDTLVLDRRDGLEPIRDARLHAATTCIGVYPDEGIAGAIDREGPLEIRFRRIVVATGAYDRPLTFPGNDLPGIIGSRAFQEYMRQRLRSAGRIGVFATQAIAKRVVAGATRAGVEIGWVAGPDHIDMAGLPVYQGLLERAFGRGRVESVSIGGRRLACELLVVGYEQPTYELQLQAGQVGNLLGEPSIVVAEGATVVPLLAVGSAASSAPPEDVVGLVVDWLAGRPAAPLHVPSGSPPARATWDSIVCFCEDVKVGDLERAVGDGFDDVELVKRRTGAGTGPCQGKMCLSQVGETLARCGIRPQLMSNRPPIRSVSLSRLAAVDG